MNQNIEGYIVEDESQEINYYVIVHKIKTENNNYICLIDESYGSYKIWFEKANGEFIRPANMVEWVWATTQGETIEAVKVYSKEWDNVKFKYIPTATFNDRVNCPHEEALTEQSPCWRNPNHSFEKLLKKDRTDPFYKRNNDSPTPKPYEVSNMLVGEGFDEWMLDDFIDHICHNHDVPSWCVTVVVKEDEGTVDEQTYIYYYYNL